MVPRTVYYTLVSNIHLSFIISPQKDSSQTSIFVKTQRRERQKKRQGSEKVKEE